MSRRIWRAVRPERVPRVAISVWLILVWFLFIYRLYVAGLL